MIIYKTAAALNSYLKSIKRAEKTLGFVPTMGALHKGHLSLICSSKKDNDLTVASIFINPIQFNNQEDFDKYPITIEQDVNNLISAGCDILFLPSKEQFYPIGFERSTYPLGYLENILEGKYRKGHFQGVAQVVDLLLDMVHPDNLYIGQKDYQQCLVIKHLLMLRYPQVQLHIHPTVREEDGLAMSSRNARLT